MGEIENVGKAESASETVLTHLTMVWQMRAFHELSVGDLPSLQCLRHNFKQLVCTIRKIRHQLSIFFSFLFFSIGKIKIQTIPKDLVGKDEN